MNRIPTIPETCRNTLAEIEASPLDLSPGAEAHLRGCPACAEARVWWLAQEEAAAVAPPGYFERLPDRVLTKLPPGPRRHRPHLALWGLAASLLVAAGVGGFLAGRANRTPMVEATLAPPAATDSHEPLPDIPFQEDDEDFAQLPNLSPEQTRQVLEQVRSQENHP